MKAVILAGGLGVRLHPYTYEVPKPMLLVGNKPILERLIEHYSYCGIKEFILAVGYKKEHIKDYFGDGSRLGVKITYSEEEVLLDTGGALKKAQPLVGNETFVCSVGDILTTVDLRKVIEFHRKEGGIGTIVVKKHSFPIDYGIVEFQDGKISSFVEKPHEERFVNTGIYVFEPKIFDYIPPNTPISLEKEILPKVLKAGEKLNAYVTTSFWMDVARPSDYELAKSMFPKSVPVEWVEGI